MLREMSYVIIILKSDFDIDDPFKTVLKVLKTA